MKTTNINNSSEEYHCKRGLRDGYLEGNADQVCCCFKMKENIAVFNTNDNASVGKWEMDDEEEEIVVGAYPWLGQEG